MTAPTDKGQEMWCSSCGSSIPAGYEACPVCGMPVEGAYDDDALVDLLLVPTVPVNRDKDEEEERGQLASAVPQVPVTGVSESSEETRVKRSRLVAMAVLCALVLISGVTLFIVRPWDPDAYSIRATEDADTSMEGFPGLLNHLTSQDVSVEDEYRKTVEENQARLDLFEAELGSFGDETEDLYASLMGFMSNTASASVKDRHSAAASLKSGFDAAVKEVRALNLTEDDQVAQRDELLALATYLGHEVDIVTSAWIAAAQHESLADAAEAARVAFGSVEDGRGVEEWRTLFSNAWAAYRERP